MTVGITPKGHLGIRLEESFASGGDVTDWQPFISEDLSLSKAYSMEDRIMNTPEQVGARIMQEGLGGSVTFGITPQNPTVWWKAGIGGTASPFSPARPLKSMVVEVHKDIETFYSSGDMITSLDISSSAGGQLQCNANIEGAGFNVTSEGSPSFTSGDTPFLHTEGVFEFNDVECDDIVDISFSVNNNNVTDLYANKKNRRAIPATKCMVTGSFTKIFQDTDELNSFLNETSMKIEATYSRGSNQFKIQVDKARFISHGAGMSSQTAYISEAIEFVAFVEDIDNDNSISITVT